jgi:antirestriction protein ArdC
MVQDLIWFAYAIEELVAELGAAFICADLEIALQSREDHAAYIESWLKVLAQDTRPVFTAASHAQRAADFIHAAASATLAAQREPHADTMASA